MFRGRHVFAGRSGDVARKRLKLLLAADKANCSPEFLEMIRDDVFAVVSKYLEIDRGDVEVGLTRTLLGRKADLALAVYAAMPADGRLMRGHFHAAV